MSQFRVGAYIDGFNLYYGMRSHMGVRRLNGDGLTYVECYSRMRSIGIPTPL